MKQFTVSKVIFDLDGTLVDTAPDLLRATNYVLESVGRPSVNLESVRHMVGHGALRLIELGLEATGGVNEHNLESLKSRFLEYYEENICVDSVPFPGVKKTLQTLKKSGFQLGICTNKPRYLAQSLIAHLNIDHFFDAVTGGDSYEFKKPDPRHILQTAAQLSGDGSIVMVGDSKPDIAGAKAANIPSILVSFGYSAHPLRELDADVIISEFAALAAHLTLDAK